MVSSDKEENVGVWEPVDPAFRALSGRLKFPVRRHQFNKGSVSWGQEREVGRFAESFGVYQEAQLKSQKALATLNWGHSSSSS